MRYTHGWQLEEWASFIVAIVALIMAVVLVAAIVQHTFGG